MKTINKILGIAVLTVLSTGLFAEGNTIVTGELAEILTGREGKFQLKD